MNKKTDKPLIGPDGEVRELDDDFFAKAKRGRPKLPEGAKKRRVNIMLEPDIDAALKAEGGNLSARVNKLLRADLGL